MALTPEEKAAGKEQRAVHRQAHRARLKAFRAFEESAHQEVDQRHQAARDAAEAERQAALDASDARQRAHRQAVAALEEGFATDMMAIAAELDRTRLIAGEANERWRVDRRAAEQHLLEQFPDMAGSARWSAAAWRPL